MVVLTMSKINWLPVALLATCAGLAGAQDPGIRLPDIGSSAGELAMPREMQEYGASMLHEMRAMNYILDDPLLNDYLDGLGHRLVAQSDRPDLSFTFFIVRDNDINAFAAPGGYIGANAGLITAMNREDEFAAVVAHEIAHVTQQHLLRAYEDMKKSSIPITLAMLGLMIAGAGRGDDTAPAALMSGTALMQQRQINFTRKDEIEADRIGIQTLARADFDPVAMADTFATLGRTMRVNGIDVPEFLRTHPVDTNRIADAKARAAQMTTCGYVNGVLDRCVGESSGGGKPQGAALPAAPVKNPFALPAPSVASTAPGAISANLSRLDRSGSRDTFLLMRERVRVLTARSPAAMVGYYADTLKADPAFDTPSNRYGYGLALTRARQLDRAVEELTRLAERHPGQATFQLALAAAEDHAGRHAEAERRYSDLHEDFPGNRAISLAYADSLLSRGQPKSARDAQNLLRPLLDSYSDDPDLQTSFARASELAGDKVRAAEAYAEAAWLKGRAEDALNQLKALTKQDDLDYYQRARVEARITAMTPLVLELRRRGTKPGDPQQGSLTEPALSVSRPEQPLSSRRNSFPLQ
ncbi:Putative Zn-dependent protease [Dokdonella koreensis DS-123]|uniref:Putative beta-barrel assembly-enhancing protease n=2 Tax=Dokdonella TaxID=323413 RepID=A0A160DVW6_9GAMM|nr:Putative Zn-dependent protease [Dokdonella koreensis DS-123]